MQRFFNSPLLYLDYDGVLHADDVYLVRGRPVLRREGRTLFEWAPILADLLAPHPEVRIVLSTSWVRVLSFDAAKAALPAELAARVVGATFHRALRREWEMLDRLGQVTWHVSRHNVTHWLAVDNEFERLPARYAHNLVQTNSTQGLATPGIATQLRESLRGVCAAWSAMEPWPALSNQS